MCGDAGYSGVGEDVNPEAHTGDEHEYFKLERGESEGHWEFVDTYDVIGCADAFKGLGTVDLDEGNDL